MPAGIEFRQVSKRYGDERSPLVVKGIDLVIDKGTLTTILGPSGCGKTTLLRMIAGLDPASAGQVFIDGQDVTHLGPAERNVSMVFQSYALFPHMTVADNVGYGLSVTGVARPEIERRTLAAMDSVGLSGYGQRLPSELSGGQQQRVAVARALVLEPSVMLFDEPLSNLDARLRRSMREEIRSLQQRLGLTVAYVTHDQSEALAVSDQIVVMDAGRIAQAGSPRQLYEHPCSEFVAASWARPCCSWPKPDRTVSSVWGRCACRPGGPWRPGRSRWRCGRKPGRWRRNRPLRPCPAMRWRARC
jgi:iron(III) transport system ATP-binding protein